MLDFLFGKFIRNSAQKEIEKLSPKIVVHIPREIPIPSVGIIKRSSAVVAQINSLEESVSRMTMEQLKAKTEEFRKRFREATEEGRKQLKEAEEHLQEASTDQERQDLELELERLKADYKKFRQKTLDEILPEAFAVVRETGKRVLEMRHFDIQLLGGMVLHQGKIAEMATGEGKTLVATLPAYLNAITGDGVHVVTVNDYLARRDREWMGPIYESLGLTVGVILHDLAPHERKAAYAADITYGTNNEFGFDYLRDNMVNFKEEMAQRGHNFAIVDEVDSILVDEARTPLIISGPAEESTDKYYRAHGISNQLKGRRITESEEVDAKYRNEDLTIGYDYIANEKNKSISLTDDGETKGAKLFGVANIHDMETIEYRHHILQALRAKEFFKLDVDYVVRDGQVIIVDEFTGRMMPGRRWSDGLHQAVEAREGIKIERENQTLATITFQNYFRMYDKLSGMTGTAYTEATEFEQIYKLETVVMPTNRVLERKNYNDCIYRSIREKYTAVVEEIADCHKRGQPALVGTISIEKSEKLSHFLKQRGIPHQVLNAKYHELEAQIVAQAGRFKGVTIATNMAGRGTDIVLGGNPDFLARNLAAQKAGENDEERENLTKKFLEQFKTQCKEEHAKVVAAGGLHVIGTERHESRRIDNQLRGRSGRQGDPGSSRFYVSLEDDLMRLFGEGIMNMWNRLGVEEGQVIEHPLVTRTLEQAQKRVETYNFEIRKQLLEFDNVMNKQREAIYGLRRLILESENVKDRIFEAAGELVAGMIEQYLFTSNQAGQEEAWDIDGLELYLNTKFHFNIAPQKEKMRDMSREEIHEMILNGLKAIYEHREQSFGVEQMRHMEKILLLNTIDTKWKDHLYAMDQLKEGVGLRSYGQRDPILEYKREGFEMFAAMYASINEEVAETIFRIQPAGEHQRLRGVFSSLPQQMVHQTFSGLTARPGPAPSDGGPVSPVDRPSAPARPPEAPQPVVRSGPKVGRNDPCPCGSGKKYKKCCGQ